MGEEIGETSQGLKLESYVRSLVIEVIALMLICILREFAYSRMHMNWTSLRNNDFSESIVSFLCELI